MSASGLKQPEELLELAETDLREMCKVYCFEPIATVKPMKIKNRQLQLLHGHLAIEHVISAFLVQKLDVPEAISFERWSFRNKLDLLYSLGGMPEFLFQTIKGINKLRNEASHKFGFRLNKSHIDILMKSLPTEVTSEIDQGNQLREVIGFCLFFLEDCRHKDLFDEVIKLRSFLKLKSALNDFKTAQS